jgi:hypothetical protein
MTVSDISTLKAQVFEKLRQNPSLMPQNLCKLLDIDYNKYGHYVRNLRSEWKRHSEDRLGPKCLSLHNVHGVTIAKCADREKALSGGWLSTKAKNHMLVWKQSLGRLEWHVNGTVRVFVRSPIRGHANQLLANAFFKNGLVEDFSLFNGIVESLVFRGASLVVDVGVKLPRRKVDFLEESNGIELITGDSSHPTGIEVSFWYPDYAEKSTKAVEECSRLLEFLNAALGSAADCARNVKPREDHGFVV